MQWAHSLSDFVQRAQFSALPGAKGTLSVRLCAEGTILCLTLCRGHHSLSDFVHRAHSLSDFVHRAHYLCIGWTPCSTFFIGQVSALLCAEGILSYLLSMCFISVCLILFADYGLTEEHLSRKKKLSLSEDVSVKVSLDIFWTAVLHSFFAWGMLKTIQLKCPISYHRSPASGELQRFVTTINREEVTVVGSESAVSKVMHVKVCV